MSLLLYVTLFGSILCWCGQQLNAEEGGKDGMVEGNMYATVCAQCVDCVQNTDGVWQLGRKRKFDGTDHSYSM